MNNKVQKVIVILSILFTILLSFCCSNSDNKKPKKLSAYELDSINKKFVYFSNYHDSVYSEIVDMYLKSGADPNFTDSNGAPALMIAVKRRNPYSVKVILKYNPEVNFKDEGMTPLIMAAGLAEPEISKMLLDKGANVHTKDTMGNTAVINAVGIATILSTFRAFETSKILIEYGANVNDIGYDSMNVLQFAVEMGEYDIVELLLENGANVKHKDKKGRTALSMAKEGYNSKMIYLLEKYLKGAKNRDTK